jgi:hypothetical protein
MGPLCSAIGNSWMRSWLSAHQRAGRLKPVRMSALALPVAAVACQAVSYGQQLPASAAICLLNTGLVLWLSVRASLVGDLSAQGIAADCTLMLPAVAGLYALAMKVAGLGPGVQCEMVARLAGRRATCRQASAPSRKSLKTSMSLFICGCDTGAGRLHSGHVPRAGVLTTSSCVVTG